MTREPQKQKKAEEWAFAAVLLLPALCVLGADFLWRSDRLFSFSGSERAAYALSWLRSLVTWGVVLFSVCGPKSWARSVCTTIFLFGFALTLSGQGYFFEQYRSYFNVEVSRFATDFTESVLAQIWADRAHFALYLSAGLSAAVGVVLFGRNALSPRPGSLRLARFLLPFVIASALFLPVRDRSRQPCPPDLLYLTGAGGILKTQLGLSADSGKLRPRARKSRPVPRLRPRAPLSRNVVFVILESVRKDATCSEPEEKCTRTPGTHALFPDRHPLNQLRALDSSTAISMAVLLSGLGPHEDRDAMHTWPLLFDYARSAGYHTAFWTSQSMLFGNMGLWYRNFGVESFLSASDIDPESHVDLGAPEDRFTDVALEHLHVLKEPFFLTVQLSNGHYPYLVQEQYPRPFSPASSSKAPEDNEAFKNYYQNAVYQQDLHLARLLQGIMNLPSGERTVVVYTSDHGEAFREHHQMGHTFSVLDEEVLVPGFVSAPEGTLSEEERSNLKKHRNSFAFHPDLTATVLDLLGVLGLPEIEGYTSRMVGESLLRPDSNTRALPLTNCSSVWTCAFENWGVMQGKKKLEAREWDFHYHCFDLELDPEERLDLGEASCPELKAVAERTFGRLPGKGK